MGIFSFFRKKPKTEEERKILEEKRKNRERKNIRKIINATNKPLTKIEDSIAFQLPFEMLLDDCTFTLKYPGFARCVKIRNADKDYLDVNSLHYMYTKFNILFKNLPENCYIHHDLIRSRAKYPAPKDRPYAPLTTRLCEYMRQLQFDNMEYFHNDIYITFSYIIGNEKMKALQDFLISENSVGKKEKSKKRKSQSEIEVEEWEKSFGILKKEHRNFEENFNMFIGLLQEAVPHYEILGGSDLMNYLSFSVNPQEEVANENRMCPPVGFFIDEYIPYSDLTDESHFKVGDYYTKIVSQNFLPNEVTDMTFRRIFDLPFPMRFVSRFVPLTKEEAINLVNKSMQFHNFRKHSLFQYMAMASSKETAQNAKADEHEESLSEEARLLLQDLRNDEVGFGIMTQTLILQDKNLKRLDDNLQIVLREFISSDIKATDDKYNGLDAYIGAVPSNIKANVRKMPIHTTAFPYFISTSSSWNGSPIIKQRNNDEALIKTLNRNGELFHFDIFDGDVGNTIILGSIGSGKSVLLNTIANYSLKYKDTQVFYFDVDSSSRALCKANNGLFYDIGGEKDNIQFQPLKRLDNDLEMSWADNFIKCLIAQENEKLLTPDANKEIWTALKLLSSKPVEDRTISGFVAFVQNPDIKEALRIYTKDGAYGMYFDGNNEEIGNAQIVVFEMGKIMDIPKIVNPLSMYLMYYIETQRLTEGKPTYVITDEAHAFFSNKYFTPILKRQLLTSRKKNCHYIFATQSGNHILYSDIRDSILDQCFTKIALPNRDVHTEDWQKIYKAFGFNTTEINAIKNAQPKKEYFMKNHQGSAIFSLCLTNIDLAYVGVASKEFQNLMDSVYADANSLKELNINWLKNLANLKRINQFELETAIDFIENVNLEELQ